MQVLIMRLGTVKMGRDVPRLILHLLGYAGGIVRLREAVCCTDNERKKLVQQLCGQLQEVLLFTIDYFWSSEPLAAEKHRLYVDSQNWSHVLGLMWV